MPLGAGLPLTIYSMLPGEALQVHRVDVVGDALLEPAAPLLYAGSVVMPGIVLGDGLSGVHSGRCDHRDDEIRPLLDPEVVLGRAEPPRGFERLGREVETRPVVVPHDEEMRVVILPLLGSGLKARHHRGPPVHRPLQTAAHEPDRDARLSLSSDRHLDLDRLADQSQEGREGFLKAQIQDRRTLGRSPDEVHSAGWRHICESPNQCWGPVDRLHRVVIARLMRLIAWSISSSFGMDSAP